MKKYLLSPLLWALCLKAPSAVAQLPNDATAPSGERADSVYTNRKLHLEEINLVSSYYRQDGNNSAVTGGVGDEHLTDFATVIDLNMVRYDQQARKHDLRLEMGVDLYTSASSDKIDPATISSASYSDKRWYPTLSYSITDDRRGASAGIAASYSHEYDYRSYGLGLNFSKASEDKNRELSLHLQAYRDTWEVILPIELRNGSTGKYRDGTAPRNSYSASLAYSWVINPRLQASLLADGIYQEGLLATRYQRVYFSDYSLQAETLPEKRVKFPVGLRVHYFAGSRFIIRSYYRYYTDDWGIRAHTLGVELPVKVSPFLSVAPLYRYYTQTASDYFAPIYGHHPADAYFTSDYDLSAFQSHFAGVNIRYTPEKGLFGFSRMRSAELRYGHYSRSNGLASDILTLALQFR